MAMFRSVVISSLITMVIGAQNYIYMDSEQSCGESTLLDDDNQFKVQTMDDVSADSTGHFPCYQIFYSNDEVVCLSPMLFSFTNCTMQLSYYTFVGDVPDITTLTREKLIDCTSDMTEEWCSPAPANVIIGFTKLEPEVNLKNFVFLLDVARITSSLRSTFMFSNCGLKTHLHHSRVHVLMLANSKGEKSCTKTFSYYQQGAVREKSELCLKFERWPGNSCSSFELQIFDHEDDTFSPYKSYSCSESVPDEICFESNHMTLKIVTNGKIEDERSDFKLQVVDSYAGDNEDSSGLSSRTIIIIACCCSFGGMIVIFVIAVCCCKKRGGLVNWPSFPSLPSLPSLPSGPSLPSLAGGDDD